MYHKKTSKQTKNTTKYRVGNWQLCMLLMYVNFDSRVHDKDLNVNNN